MKQPIIKDLEDALTFLGPNGLELAAPTGGSAALNRRQFLVLTGFSGMAIGLTGLGSAARAGTSESNG